MAHGLWGVALTPKNQASQIKWSVFWSIFPDLLWASVTVPYMALNTWKFASDWPDAPKWFYILYGSGHSLLIWGLVSAILLPLKMWRWPILFWVLHILVDILGHTTFLTPILFPLSNFMLPGIFSWSDYSISTLSHLIPVVLIALKFTLKPKR